MQKCDRDSQTDGTVAKDHFRGLFGILRKIVPAVVELAFWGLVIVWLAGAFESKILPITPMTSHRHLTNERTDTIHGRI